MTEIFTRPKHLCLWVSIWGAAQGRGSKTANSFFTQETSKHVYNRLLDPFCLVVLFPPASLWLPLPLTLSVKWHEYFGYVTPFLSLRGSNSILHSFPTFPCLECTCLQYVHINMTGVYAVDTLAVSFVFCWPLLQRIIYWNIVNM